MTSENIMNEDYLPKEVLKWREKNKDRLEQFRLKESSHRKFKSLNEVFEELNKWVDDTEEFLKDREKIK